MTICSRCKNKICEKSGRVCEEVEKLLPKPSTGRLKGEHSFDPSLLNDIDLGREGWERAGGGWRKKPQKYNWED